MLAALLPIIAGILQPIIQNIFPNPEDKLKAQELQNQLTLAIINNAAALEQAAAANVKAEIQAEGWLQRNWRPILMLTFAGIIVARFFGYTAPGLDEEEALKLWDILQIGIGGYVIGRSAEKIIPVAAQNIAQIVKK